MRGGQAFLFSFFSSGPAPTPARASTFGKGTIDPGHCQLCFPEPAGCTFFECDNRACSYTCTAPDGSTFSLSRPRRGGGQS